MFVQWSRKMPSAVLLRCLLANGHTVVVNKAVVSLRDHGSVVTEHRSLFAKRNTTIYRNGKRKWKSEIRRYSRSH